MSPFPLLRSEVLIVSDADSRSKSWMGDKVPHSSEPLHTGKAIGYGNVKSIVPTHTAFQVGLHGAGACVMDTPVGCPSSNPFCHTNGREIQAADYFHRTHYLDEWVFMTDAKLVSLATEGCLYHYQIHRPHFAPSDETDLTTQNIYTAHYFKSVIAALKKRRLDLLVDIPYRTF